LSTAFGRPHCAAARGKRIGTVEQMHNKCIFFVRFGYTFLLTSAALRGIVHTASCGSAPISGNNVFRREGTQIVFGD
jgi:hypothetical protein